MVFKAYFFSAKLRAAVCLCFIASVLIACANERSNEEKKREDQRRQLERLKRAEGDYSGYALREDAQAVPAAIRVDVLKNPDNGEDKPEVQVKLRLGFFAGVALTSTSTSFDWKTGELNASFMGSSKEKPAAAAGGIELHAIVDGDDLKSAELKGGLSGKSKLQLTKTDELTLLENQQTYDFSLRKKVSARGRTTEGPEFAVLSIKTLPNSRVAPERSDLPELPSLEASFSFSAINHAESTRKVFYDPLEGTLEIRSQDYAKFVFKNLFVADTDRVSDEALLDAGIDGQVFVGASLVADVTGAFKRTNETPSVQLTKVYTGTYTPRANQRTFKTVTYLDQLGRVGRNQGESVFATFPAIRLRILICTDGGRTFQQRNAELFQLDYVNSKAMLSSATRVDQPQGEALIYDLAFDRGWEHLNGAIIFSNAGAGGSSGGYGRLELTRADGDYSNGCAELEDKP